MRPFGGAPTKELPMVWVECGVDYRPIRIFRSKKAAFAAGIPVVPTSRALAIQVIRHKLWLRSQGECELCGSWLLEETGQMHERQHRGKGGEISMENSVFICFACHRDAHADRNPRWSKHEEKA